MFPPKDMVIIANNWFLYGNRVCYTKPVQAQAPAARGGRRRGPPPARAGRGGAGGTESRFRTCTNPPSGRGPDPRFAAARTWRKKRRRPRFPYRREAAPVRAPRFCRRAEGAAGTICKCAPRIRTPMVHIRPVITTGAICKSARRASRPRPPPPRASSVLAAAVGVQRERRLAPVHRYLCPAYAAPVQLCLFAVGHREPLDLD